MPEAGGRASANDVVAAIIRPLDRDDEDYGAKVRRRAASAVHQLDTLVHELAEFPDKIDAKYAKLEKHLAGKATELRDAKRDLAQAKRDLKAAQDFFAGLEG